MIFADEPTGNLDSTSSREVLELLRRAVDEFGQTVVMVTHDPDAAQIADEIIEMADGKIVRRRSARVTRVVLRGLFARRLRLALTAFAVALGVTLVAGTYVFTDTINASFDTIFTKAYDEDGRRRQPERLGPRAGRQPRADARVGARQGRGRPTASRTPRAASSTSAGPS